MRTLFKNFSILFLILIAVSSCELIEDTESEFTIKTISENITESVTWERGSTITIDGTVRVGSENQTVIITIEPSVTIKFTKNGNLDFAYWDNEYASITANGTKDNPIIFTSSSPVPSAGDWNGLNFYKGAINCQMSNCIFEYGGNNDYYGNIYIEETAVSFTDCQFVYSASSAIRLKTDGSFSSFNNNMFMDIKDYPISIYPSGVSTIGLGNSYESGSSIFIEGSEGFNETGEYLWRYQGVPYILDGGMRMGTKNTQGLKLTIEAGVTIKMVNDSYIDFAYWDDEYATIIAVGTEEFPIKFTSNSPSPSAGDWKSLNFYTGAVNCEFDFCEFEYGGSNDYKGNIYIEETAVSFTNCKFSNSKSYAINLKSNGEFFDFFKNTFTNHAIYPISIYPNAVHSMGTGNVFESGSSIYVDADENLDISGEYTWLNQDVPFTMDGTFRIGSINGTTLNINAGTVLKFTNGSQIDVSYWDDNNAKLITKGTASEPVIFTSNSPAPAKGDWDGINFYNGISGSILDYCTVDYAGANEYYGAVSLSESGNNIITFSNSTISNSNSHGITVDNSSSVDYNTITFINNEGEDYHVR